MAQPDLVAQKILGTDPRVGFGESVVLPYQKDPLDTRGFEAMERAKTRQQMAEDDLKKSNEAFYNERIGKLNEYNHLFNTHMDQQRKNLIDVATKTVASGKRLQSDGDFNQAFSKFQASAQSSKQLQKEYEDIEKLTAADVGKYVDLRELKGASAKKLGEVALKVNNGDESAWRESIKPDLTSPEFFKIDEFLYDKTKDIKASSQVSDSVIGGSLGQYVERTEKGYKFSTRDENGDIIPGVDKSVVDYFLNLPTDDSDTLMFRSVIGNLADKTIENKALQIMKSDPAYRGMSKDEVPEVLKRLKQQIAYDPNSKYFEGRDAIQETILKGKLNPFQESTEKTEIRGGHKNPSNNDGSGGNQSSTPEELLVKSIAGLQQQTPEFLEGFEESEDVNENGVPYFDATSLFKGIKTGEDENGKAIEPDAVYVDPQKQGVVYVRQKKGGPLIAMSGAALTQFLVRIGNIKGNNLSYKTIVSAGKKYGVWGDNNNFIGQNAATTDPVFNKQQKAIANKVEKEVVNRKAVLKGAIGEDKASWITDFSRTKVDAIQNKINNDVLKGTTLVDKDGVSYKDPKVEIERGFLGGVTYVIKGSDGSELKLTDEEFSAIAEGKSDAGKLVVGRDAVKNKAAKTKDAASPKAEVKKYRKQNGITYTYNPKTGQYE
jgi:hypothetical protein